MTLSNKGLKRSAIDVEPGGTLNLWIAEGAEVTVNSGLGENANANTPGKGGYAGIHIPEGSILNLKGYGTIKAIGGNAGGGFIGSSTLQAGGGGAGAGIGGNGGNGGIGKIGSDSRTQVSCPPGGNGENCGEINIYNGLIVYAYGGGGGAGGANSSDNGGGAGGYPGAGIGGGGAGGAGSTCCAGAGGYTGGSAEGNNTGTHNGLAGKPGGYAAYNFPRWEGGGYYVGNSDIGSSSSDIQDLANGVLGGAVGNAWYVGHSGGHGGKAGSGGKICVSENVSVYAYNGNRYTDGTSYDNGKNEAAIYLQAGIKIANYELIGADIQGTSSAPNGNYFPIFKLMSSQNNNFPKSGYCNGLNATITFNSVLSNCNMKYQGVGSGAGYIEISNGTYTIDSSLN